MYKITIAFLLLAIPFISYSQNNIVSIKNIDHNTDRILTFFVYHNNEPVSNTTIDLEKYGMKSSDENGKIIYSEVAPNDTLSYKVNKTGYVSIEDSIIIHEHNLERDIHLEKAAYEIVFKVKANGALIEGANVKLNGYGTKLTNDEGQAIFEQVNTSDSIAYEITALGYSPAHGYIQVNDEGFTKIVELSIAEFNVKFYVAVGEEPIEGVKVTFHTYGSKLTDSEGEAEFPNVQPGIGLVYTLEVDGYSPLTGAINVLNNDVIEEIIFAAPSYTLTFEVLYNDKPYEGAEVDLEGYSIRHTNKYGFTRYLNVLPDTVHYNIKTHSGFVGGSIIITNADAKVTVRFTPVNENNLSKLKIYPNPATDFFNFEADKIGVVEIYSLSGNLIYQQNVISGLNRINTEALKNGIYYIRYSSETNHKTKKLVISR